jgi:hypothetical protein
MREKYPRIRQPEGDGRRQFLLSAPKALIAEVSASGRVARILAVVGYGGE